nr:MAG TPA: hypothetical protein [Caudoviricetes sp.]
MLANIPGGCSEPRGRPKPPPGGGVKRPGGQVLRR